MIRKESKRKKVKSLRRSSKRINSLNGMTFPRGGVRL